MEQAEPPGMRPGAGLARPWLVAAALAVLIAGGVVGRGLLTGASQASLEGNAWTGSLTLPPEQASAAWPQPGGSAEHIGSHLGIGPLQGQVVWQAKTGGPIISSPVGGAGTLYVASGDGLLYAVQEQDGTVRWRFPLGAKLVNSTPALAGGLILVAGDYSWLNAIDAATGTRIWRYNTGETILAPPASDAQENLAFVSSGATLLALDLRDGHRHWLVQVSDSRDTAWPSVGAPAIGNSTVFWGPGIGHRLLALDESTGNSRWSLDTGDRLASAQVLSDHTVYVATWHGSLFAVDAATGARRWQRTLGQGRVGEGTEASPALDRGRLYIGSYQGTLYALDASTGADLWRFQTGGPILSQPAVSEGLVYVSSEDGNLYALDAGTGRMRWRLRLGEMRASPALADGELSIGTMAGEFIRVR